LSSHDKNLTVHRISAFPINRIYDCSGNFSSRMRLSSSAMSSPFAAHVTLMRRCKLSRTSKVRRFVRSRVAGCPVLTHASASGELGDCDGFGAISVFFIAILPHFCG
jgi:hypothetical protein